MVAECSPLCEKAIKTAQSTVLLRATSNYAVQEYIDPPENGRKNVSYNFFFCVICCLGLKTLYNLHLFEYIFFILSSQYGLCRGQQDIQFDQINTILYHSYVVCCLQGQHYVF